MSDRIVTLCGRPLKRPGHICAFFDSREQQYDVLAPYYREGLDAGEEVITIVSAADESDHHSRLRAHGIDVQAALDADRLKVYTDDHTFTLGGRFDAQRMYDLLEGALQSARQHNRFVRTSGVMEWATSGCAGCEQVMDYEAKINLLVPTYGCTVLCAYDLATLSGPMVMDLLATHPYVIHRRRVLQSAHYLPPLPLLREALLENASHPTPTSTPVIN